MNTMKMKLASSPLLSFATLLAARVVSYVADQYRSTCTKKVQHGPCTRDYTNFVLH